MQLTTLELAEQEGVSIRTIQRRRKKSKEISTNDVVLKLLENQNKLLETVIILQQEIKELKFIINSNATQSDTKTTLKESNNSYTNLCVSNACDTKTTQNDTMTISKNASINLDLKALANCGATQNDIKTTQNDTKKRKEKTPLINPLKRKEKKLKPKPFLQNQVQEATRTNIDTTQQPKKSHSKTQIPALDLPVEITEDFITAGLQVNPKLDLSSIYIEFRASRVKKNYTNNNWLNAWISYITNRKFHKNQGAPLIMHKEQKTNNTPQSHSSAIQIVNTTTAEELKQQAIQFISLKSKISSQIDDFKQQEWKASAVKDKQYYRKEASKLSFSLQEKKQALEWQFNKNSHILNQNFHLENYLFALEDELDSNNKSNVNC